MQFLTKLKFFWKKPKVIVITNDNQELVKKAVSLVLGHSLEFQREVLITDNQKITDFLIGRYLILNYDEENIRKIKEKNPDRVLTFGFQEGADFRASDLKINGGINFKINYKENVVPIWLKEEGDKNRVYAVLAAACVGTIFDLNLIEISQAIGSLTP
jgi:UDP-N-acetylmuramyl pentapeptide synthase